MQTLQYTKSTNAHYAPVALKLKVCELRDKQLNTKKIEAQLVRNSEQEALKMSYTVQ